MPLNSIQEEGDHYEILIRLEVDEVNLILPCAFIPAAERYQLAVELDQWVIRNLFDWFLQHPDRLQALALCSINLSASSLAGKEMSGFIAEQFKKTGLPPDKFCFEITETAIIANLTTATEFIISLKELGCLFSLDDFGSGFSSFSYLKNLQVDFLKMDGIHVRNIESDPVSLEMVKSINDIAHLMGKKTIAKFVENDEVLKILMGLKVDYVQGYGNDIPSVLL
jgi:EAL domain-containing protein (putative c-di-GMP-specific phosphodiesterase class I)